MSFKNLCARGALVAAAVMVLCAVSAQAQTVTVVEYYNKSLDAYFVTGRAKEQTALDAVADFQRTGMTFQATAVASAAASQTKICRFYISATTPYVSSHFYGRQGIDCESIRAQNLAGFSYEDYDFATQQPTSGTCPAGTTAIYRGFRAAANGTTSNHRYSASPATYAAAVTAGYVGESAAFCATSATPATAATGPSSGSGDCSVYFFPNKKLTLQTTATNSGFASPATTFVRTYDTTPVSFRGRTVSQVVDTTSPGVTSSTMMEDTGSTFSEIGTRGISASGTSETYFTPPIAYPKTLSIGQVINFTRSITSSPVSSTGTGTQTGTITLLGKESITVPAGTFTACKYITDQVTQYPSVGSTSHTVATSWIVNNVGIVRADITDTTAVLGLNLTGTSQLLAIRVE